MRTAGSVLLGLFVAYITGFLAIAALFLLLLAVPGGSLSDADGTKEDLLLLAGAAAYALGALAGFVLAWRMTSRWRRRAVPGAPQLEP